MDLTEFALQKKYFDEAWIFLESLDGCKPHFFWAFLADCGRRNGEAGVFDVLQKIGKFGVKVDLETLWRYCLPSCDLSNPKSLVQKYQVLGFTVKEILSPLIVVLLQKGDIGRAAQLCCKYFYILSDIKLA